MRIRVAIIEQDTGYLEKITNVFNTRYTEQVEIHAFTVMNRAIEFLQSNRVDMILVDEQIEMQLKMFPSKCNLAYLVDSMGIESVKGYPAICKFQKVDLIYKQILSIYSENSQSVSESHLNLGAGKIIILRLIGFPGKVFDGIGIQYQAVLLAFKGRAKIEMI